MVALAVVGDVLIILFVIVVKGYWMFLLLVTGQGPQGPVCRAVHLCREFGERKIGKIILKKR